LSRALQLISGVRRTLNGNNGDEARLSGGSHAGEPRYPRECHPGAGLCPASQADTDHPLVLSLEKYVARLVPRSPHPGRFRFALMDYLLEGPCLQGSEQGAGIACHRIPRRSPTVATALRSSAQARTRTPSWLASRRPANTTAVL
jgi:hypothetical protein